MVKQCFSDRQPVMQPVRSNINLFLFFSHVTTMSVTSERTTIDVQHLIRVVINPAQTSGNDKLGNDVIPSISNNDVTYYDVSNVTGRRPLRHLATPPLVTMSQSCPGLPFLETPRNHEGHLEVKRSEDHSRQRAIERSTEQECQLSEGTLTIRPVPVENKDILKKTNHIEQFLTAKKIAPDKHIVQREGGRLAHVGTYKVTLPKDQYWWQNSLQKAPKLTSLSFPSEDLSQILQHQSIVTKSQGSERRNSPIMLSRPIRDAQTKTLHLRLNAKRRTRGLFLSTSGGAAVAETPSTEPILNYVVNNQSIHVKPEPEGKTLIEVNLNKSRSRSKGIKTPVLVRRPAAVSSGGATTTPVSRFLAAGREGSSTRSKYKSMCVVNGKGAVVRGEEGEGHREEWGEGGVSSGVECGREACYRLELGGGAPTSLKDAAGGGGGSGSMVGQVANPAGRSLYTDHTDHSLTDRPQSDHCITDHKGTHQDVLKNSKNLQLDKTILEEEDNQQNTNLTQGKNTENNGYIREALEGKGHGSSHYKIGFNDGIYDGGSIVNVSNDKSVVFHIEDTHLPRETKQSCQEAKGFKSCVLNDAAQNHVVKIPGISGILKEASMVRVRTHSYGNSREPQNYNDGSFTSITPALGSNRISEPQLKGPSGKPHPLKKSKSVHILLPNDLESEFEPDETRTRDLEDCGPPTYSSAHTPRILIHPAMTQDDLLTFDLDPTTEVSLQSLPWRNDLQVETSRSNKLTGHVSQNTLENGVDGPEGWGEKTERGRGRRRARSAAPRPTSHKSHAHRSISPAHRSPVRDIVGRIRATSAHRRLRRLSPEQKQKVGKTMIVIPI